MSRGAYFMEGEEEAIRLDVKTDGQAVEDQAVWAGIQTGMHVADLGCGAGKTTFHLNKLVHPGGRVVGVDIAEQRIRYAQSNYCDSGIEFVVHDIRRPLDGLGAFDFIWIRFVLEYYLKQSFAIVQTIEKALKPGGILCLIDLDCNCLRFHGLPARLERAVNVIMKTLEQNNNFDPHVGIKLYSFLYDMGYQDIKVRVSPHNLIYGKFKESEVFNWTKKAELAGKLSGVALDEYDGGFEEFIEEVKDVFADPRTFTYTPLLVCRGRKPAS
jgi:SAM-dependent methyltransferase